MIKLVNDTIDNNDIDKLIKWLQTYPRLTKGELTIKFEEKWSNWL
jgi:CDP-4-dehydro-6-deoxyglucose reductase, E1